MRIMKNIQDFSFGVLKNPYSQVLVVLHLVIVGLLYAFMPRQEGFGYHFSIEPLYYQFIFYLNLPAILLVGLIFWPFFSMGYDTWVVLQVYAISLIVASSIQWAMVGYMVSWALARFGFRKLGS